MNNSSMGQVKDRTLALAGVFQAAQMVKQLALHGKTDARALRASLDSILHLQTPNVVSVFGHQSHLRLGLLSVQHFVDQRVHKNDRAVLRYVVGILSLSKRVLTNPQIFQQLQRRLVPVVSQVAHFAPDDPLVINHLSTIYKQVFLERNLRIPVEGRLEYFKATEITDKIRSALLAGIRAGVLWFQVGGQRWQLLFQRTHLQKQVHALLHEQSANPLSN